MLAQVKGNCLEIRQQRLLTQGSVGETLDVSFSEEWTGLAVTAIFSAGSLLRDVLVDSETIPIPWELLREAAHPLFLNFHGARADGSIVMRTNIASLGIILPSRAPVGESSEPPSPSLVDQIQAAATEALAVARSVRNDADSGAFNGQDGTGQPIPVTQAAQMTDTNALYLYLGEETGFDYGYLYAHLQDAWTKTALYGQGQAGTDGKDGKDGVDGYSPLATVTSTATGAVIRISDKAGTTTAEVTNGTASDAQVETYVDAWLDAHPEATTSVADGSITREKMAFPAFEGAKSENLIDPSKVTSARFTNANGSIQAFSSGSYYNYWRMTDYIDVTEHIGDYISITNHNGYCFYTANKEAIAGSGEGLGMSYPANSSSDPILIPSGASYVRLVYWYRDEAITIPMANFGSTLQAYHPFGSILLPKACVSNDNIGETIRYENFEHDLFVQKTVSNNLASPNGIRADCWFNRSTGAEESRASGYMDGLTDWIRVKPKTDYYGMYKAVGFYDTDKNYLGYTANTPFKTPGNCAYVRLNISSLNFGVYAHPNSFYLTEGDARPGSVAPFGDSIPSGMLERFSVYQSVLKRMAPLYNPTIKTAVGIYGDSNTAGLESGSSGRYYQNCWANLLCQRITEVFDKNVRLYPFGKYGSWQGTYYSGTILLAGDPAFIRLSFYGTTLAVNFGQVNKGVALLSIDGGEPISYDTNTGTQYVAEGLTEAEHSLLITRLSGTVQVSSIDIHKYVTAANKGSTGSGTSYLPREDKTYDLYIAVLGTNDRGAGRTPSYIFDNCYKFTDTQMKRGAEVILVTPTPATDGFETGASAGIKMADVESAISNVCGICNLEPISFYQFLLNYCANTGTELNSLFNDTLHMKESTHALIFKFMCDKLGLGQPIADYLPAD